VRVWQRFVSVQAMKVRERAPRHADGNKIGGEYGVVRHGWADTGL